MTSPTIEGLSTRGHQLLAHFGFTRAVRDRSELEARLTEAGLPAHPIALELDRTMGGLRSPRTRRVGWLELGVLEELDDTDGYASDRIEGIDESEYFGGAWPAPSHGGAIVVPVGGGCDVTYLASKERLLCHDRMLDVVTSGPKRPLTLLEQGLLTMVLSERRLEDGIETWDWRSGPEVEAVAALLGVTRVEEACDDRSSFWIDGERMVVSDGVRHRAVGPSGAIARARSLAAG
jgi:hypothetical protein